MSGLGIYDEMAARANAAYLAFSKQYELEHPAPERTALTRDVVSVAIIVSLLIVMVAGVIVSSSRTIEEFGGSFVGVFAFVMLEGGLVAYAFFRARRAAVESNRVGNARRLATIGLTLAFVSALAANIHAVLKAQHIETPPIVNTVINLFVAVSAPTLAFISADVLAIELMSGEARRRAAEQQYESALNVWRAQLHEEWQRRQRALGVSWKVERDGERPQLSAVSMRGQVDMDNGQATGHGTGQGYTKRTNARELVARYLDEHPEAISMPVRELAALIGVGKSTVSNVLQERGNSEVSE